MCNQEKRPDGKRKRGSLEVHAHDIMKYESAKIKEIKS